MMLGEPNRVVASAIHNGDTLERHVIDGGEGLRAIEPAKELQNADLHGASPSIVTAADQGRLHRRDGIAIASGTQSRRCGLLDALAFLTESRAQKQSAGRIAN